ncbi:MAG: SpoIIE family protein phosphatase [Acidobacteriota bacterium]
MAILMQSAQQISTLLRDLQNVGRSVPRGDSNLSLQGELILRAIIRNTSFHAGAVYLTDPHRSGTLRLSGRTESYVAPADIEASIPESVVDSRTDHHFFDRTPWLQHLQPRPTAIVPIRDLRDAYGVVALVQAGSANSADAELEVLDTLSIYLSTLFFGQKMMSELREGDFQLKYRLWELESLYDIGLSIASTLDLDDLADEILARTISLLNARRAALFLKREGRFMLHRSFGDVRTEFLDAELNMEETRLLVELSSPILRDNGADCVFPECETFVALPIKSGTEVIGVLAAADRELREGGVGPFEKNDLRVLSLFASQVAIALENARLHQEALLKHAMERELELAATIQRDILPRTLPVVDGYDVEAFSRPARQLGGDYHAFFEGEGALTFCVADVSGKSVPAAVLVSALHAAFQLLVAEGRSLGDIATELNRHIHHWSAENKFITMILCTIDRQAGVVQFVNAGHNPAYVVHEETIVPLSSHGLPIGILPQTVYRAQTRPFPVGSLLLAYSDGITEAENTASEEFGNDRLEELLRGSAALPSRDLRRAIVMAVDGFVGDAPQYDDQTMVVVRTV